jgi:hypothetical protein
MLGHDVKSRIFLTLIIVVIFLLIVSIHIAEASRRTLNLNSVLEKSLVTHRTVELNGKIFDLYINQDNRSIIVKGEVADWDEKDKVEEHFKLRSPSNYQINYEIEMIF